jgi:hypothetical protein
MFPNFYDQYSYLQRDMVDEYMFGKDFTFVGEGCTRRTFLSKNRRYVIKFQIYSALYANRHEAATWRKWFGQPNPDNGGCLYAPCRLINNNILMMRAMVEIYGGTHACSFARNSGVLGGVDTWMGGSSVKVAINPDLVKWTADLCQVGKMANGKYALYDYG